MAHWAEVDNNNVVVRVIVAEDDSYDWLVENLGGTWLQTSYNTINGDHTLGGTPFRGNYAAVGYTYNEELDAFIAPKPYGSWILNESTYSWEAPVAYPEDGASYSWDENTQSWILRDEVE